MHLHLRADGGGQVTETLRAGLRQPLHRSTADPSGHRGLGGSKVTFVGPPATEAFPEVSRRGLRTTGQWVAGVDSLDTQGTPCRLLLAQEERPRASHRPSIRCHLQTQDDCHPRRESQPCPPNLQATPRSQGAWPILGGGRGRTGTVGQPRGPQPRPKCKQSLGLEEEPSLSTSRDPDCGFQII